MSALPDLSERIALHRPLLVSLFLFFFSLSRSLNSKRFFFLVAFKMMLPVVLSITFDFCSSCILYSVCVFFFFFYFSFWRASESRKRFVLFYGIATFRFLFKYEHTKSVSYLISECFVCAAFIFTNVWEIRAKITIIHMKSRAVWKFEYFFFVLFCSSEHIILNSLNWNRFNEMMLKLYAFARKSSMILDLDALQHILCTVCKSNAK